MGLWVENGIGWWHHGSAQARRACARRPQLVRIIPGELDICRIFHRKNDRVVAHVLICQLSYLLMALIDRQAKESRLEVTSITMVRAFANVTLNEVTMGPESKVHACHVTGLDEEQQKVMMALD